MKVKQGKIMLLSLIAAFITFFSLSLSNLTAVNIRAEGSSATQSATALTQKTYGIDWEGWYGKDGYVVIGDASGTYYSDMQEDNDGTTAIVDSNWKNSSNALSSFTPKANAPISTLTFGTIVWAANNDLQTYNLYKPGTNKTERLKTRAHQNNNQKYYADVFAGFTLKGNSDTYVTLNVSDHNRKVSEQTPITISVYASGRNNTNGEAYPTNPNPERFMVIDEFYAGKGGKALATATVTQQSANVTFKLAGAGEYRVVAYYNNPTALDENGAMVTTGTNSPLCPQINGFFFDKEKPHNDLYFNTTTSGAWEGVYGSDAYVIFTSGTDDNKSNLAYTKGIYIGKDNELITYWRDDVSDPEKHNPVKYNADSGYSLKGAGENGGYLEETGYLEKYYLASSGWAMKATSGGDLLKPGSTEPVRFNSGNGVNQETSSFAFKISQSAFVGKSAVYVTVYSYNAFRNANVDADFNLYLYRGYFARSGRTVSDGGNVLLQKNTVRTNARSGFYATFKLTAPGEYSINVEGADDPNCGNNKTHAGASICGVFFDAYVEPTIADVSLTLDGTIGLNFYTKTNNAENAAMKFTYADGTTETVAQPETLTDGYYKFTAKVLPKNYAQKVKAELISGDTVLDTAEYSVKDYCDYIEANSSDEKLKSLCASLVNYGAAADNYFNEAKNDVDDVTVTQADLGTYRATAQGTAPEGFAVNQISLIIESETTIRLYVTAENEVTVKVDGNEAQIKTEDNKKFIEITNIAAKDLDRVYEITIGDNYKIRCSALTYVYEIVSKGDNNALNDTVKALYAYNRAADEYFA